MSILFFVVFEIVKKMRITSNVVTYEGLRFFEIVKILSGLLRLIEIV
jgi:hypothetical protein